MNPLNFLSIPKGNPLLTPSKGQMNHPALRKGFGEGREPLPESQGGGWGGAQPPPTDRD